MTFNDRKALIKKLHLPVVLRAHLWYAFDPQTSLSFAHGRPSTTWSFTSWHSMVSSKATGLQLPACPPCASNHLPQSWPWAPTQPEHSPQISIYLYKYISKGNTYKNRKNSKKNSAQKIIFLTILFFSWVSFFLFCKILFRLNICLMVVSAHIHILTQIACHFGPGLAILWARSGSESAASGERLYCSISSVLYCMCRIAAKPAPSQTHYLHFFL